MATPIPINRCRFNPAEIVRATGAIFSGPSDLVLTGVSIDTRSIAPGALFIAMRGVRDGHEFVRAAAARGAAAVIVERGRTDPALPCFEVDDTLAALGALARFHLMRMRAIRPVPTIAIGGAAGKTTTKELTAALARALFGEILATPGNLNNLIGVPMTILMLTDAHRAAVLECGTNRRGEIERLAKIVTPDVALVLNVDIEHTEGLGSLEGVADEEAELFKSARIAIVGTAESMLLARVPAHMRTPIRTLTFGAAADAGVRLASRVVVAPGRQRIALAISPSLTANGVDPALEANLGMLGAATAMNAAAAVAAVSAAFARPLARSELAALARALATVEPVAGRLSTREVAGIVVIDDTYNANPRSVRVALEAARETADGLGARLVVALGDMLELGALAPAMHAQAVRDLYRARPDACVAVGPEMAAAVHTVESDSDAPRAAEPGAVQAGAGAAQAGAGAAQSDAARTGAAQAGADAPARPPVLQLAADSTAAAAVVRALVRAGDVLLVKGSRGIAMERIINALAAG